MAGGKKRPEQVAWQIEINTNEEWEELCQMQGLVVVDVYSEWCGPCTAMAAYLKEIKLQLGDDYLHCAVAKADCISQLIKFRNRSEPTWLFLGGGQPVAMIRGANAPLIRTTLMAELEAEKQVLSGVRQRTPLDWGSFEFPKNEPEDEEPTAVEETDPNGVPHNWDSLDALVLQGTHFQPVVDMFVQSLADERGLEIKAKLDVHVKGRPCVILWLSPATCDVDREKEFRDWLDERLPTFVNRAAEAAKTKSSEKDETDVDKMEKVDTEEKGKDDPTEDNQVDGRNETKEELDDKEDAHEQHVQTEESNEPVDAVTHSNDEGQTVAEGEADGESDAPMAVQQDVSVQLRLYIYPTEKEELIQQLNVPVDEEEEEVVPAHVDGGADKVAEVDNPPTPTVTGSVHFKETD